MGSAEYDDDVVATTPASNSADAVSLWLVFGLCIFLALLLNLGYHCWKAKPSELTEELVNPVNQDNDADDEDEVVFGRNTRSPPYYRESKIN